MMSGQDAVDAFSLKGKTALVSGASRGIGYEIARSFCEAGAKVTLLARPSSELEQKVQSLRDAGFEAHSFGFDLTQSQALEAEIRRIEAFDVLVHSAGIAKHAPFLEITPDQYYDVMKINLDAAFWLAKACAAQMVAGKKRGSVIFISSQMGHVGGMHRTVYCASKHALEGLTKAMAIELGPYGIRVNTVAPTFIETELTKNTLANAEAKEAITSKIKLGCLGVPSDVALACRYLAADAARLVTGTSLVVDGGWTAD